MPNSIMLQIYINSTHTNFEFNWITFCTFKKKTLVQKVRGSIPGGVVNFNLKIFNLGARRGGDLHFLIARLYITGVD